MLWSVKPTQRLPETSTYYCREIFRVVAEDDDADNILEGSSRVVERRRDDTIS